MNKGSILAESAIGNLILDVANPRFAELYEGSNSEDDLIEYLLYTEAGEDIAKEISQVGEFYPDKPLWVLRHKDDYLVKDGNRRCAAVKALQMPQKYGLSLDKFTLDKLPVLIYESEEDLERRIVREHTISLFREWDRIAKALEVYKLYKSGDSVESMKEIDSNPSDLLKLASFYYEAVKIAKEPLKRLLRRGRGKTGGKTIVFERLFKYATLCGYRFKGKPSYEISVSDQQGFSSYVRALVAYLEAYPETSHKSIDQAGDRFLIKLEEFGFLPKDKQTVDTSERSVSESESGSGSGNSGILSSNLPGATDTKRGTTQHKPQCKRKGIPAPLKKLIKECYNIDPVKFPNAKTALTRISFECALKYVVENTKFDNKRTLAESDVFRDAFFGRKGTKRPFTNFDELKKIFTGLILNVGKRNAFANFNLDNPHQIIHNYNVGATPMESIAICDNLMPLLDFILQDERDLLTSIDLQKL